MSALKKRMQLMPLDGEQCELLKGIIQNVLDSLQGVGDGRFDCGGRIAVNLAKRDVSRLRTALKRL